MNFAENNGEVDFEHLDLDVNMDAEPLLAGSIPFVSFANRDR